MSLTAILWLILFVTLFVCSFLRAAWAVGLYVLTFFASPEYWWWGQAGIFQGHRWNLVSSVVLLVAVVFHSRSLFGARFGIEKLGRFIVLLSAVNATLIHFVFSISMELSEVSYVRQMKLLLLLALVVSSVGRRIDFLLIVTALLLGCGYVGFEATINDRGKYEEGRLEKIGVPAAASSNDLSSLCVTFLPVFRALFFCCPRV